MKKQNILLIIILFFNSAYSQTIKPNTLLKETETSLKGIRTLVYKINKKSKFFSDNDTLQKTAICSLYIVPENKMGAYHILNVKQLSNNIYGRYQYDGQFSIEFLYKTDSLDYERKVYITNILEKESNSIGGIGYSLLLKDYFKKQNIFKQYRSFLAKFFLKDITTEESVYNGIPVYILTVYGKDKPRENRINSAVEKYYIRKSDFLPIAHSFYGEFQGMKETEFTEIEYLEINPELSLDAFKIDPSVKEVKPRVYYEEMQKYNL